jgi:hypothetical protein
MILDMEGQAPVFDVVVFGIHRPMSWWYPNGQMLWRAPNE